MIDGFYFQPPCNVGASVSDVESPALVVCMDRLERNMEQLTKAMNNYSGVSFRPHIKAHKCPMLARLQVTTTTGYIIIEIRGNPQISIKSAYQLT